MVTFKAKTLEGKEVEGDLRRIYDHETGDLLSTYISGNLGNVLIPIDPTTLRLLINGKEYTMEEVEKGMKLWEFDDTPKGA